MVSFVNSSIGPCLLCLFLSLLCLRPICLLQKGTIFSYKNCHNCGLFYVTFCFYVAQYWVETPLWLYALRLLTNTLKYVNPIVNPYLYSFKSSQFKEFHRQSLIRRSTLTHKPNQFIITSCVNRLIHGIYAVSGELDS